MATAVIEADLREDGVLVRDRLFDFSPNGVLDSTYKIDNPQEVYCVELNRYLIRRQARRFDQACPVIDRAALAVDTVLQTMLHAATEIEQSVLRDTRHPPNARTDIAPVVRFLEVVVSTADERIGDSQSYVRNDNPQADKVQEAYLLEVTANTDTNVIVHNETCEFMKDLRGQPFCVIKYRLWIFVMYSTRTLPSVLEHMLQQNRKAEEKSKNSASCSTTEYRGVPSSQRWRLPTSHEVWASFVDAANNQAAYASFRSKSALGAGSLASSTNAANPLLVFCPQTSRAWAIDREFHAVDAAYVDVAKYCVRSGDEANTITWQFPYPSRVLAIYESISTVRRFRQKYLPEFQLVCLQSSVDISFHKHNVSINQIYSSANAPAGNPVDTLLSRHEDDLFYGNQVDERLGLFAAGAPPPATSSSSSSMPRIVAEDMSNFGQNDQCEFNQGESTADGPASGLSGTSDLHTLINQGNSLYEQHCDFVNSVIDDEGKQPARLERRRHLVESRRTLANRYFRIMFESNSNLSKPTLAINAWYQSKIMTALRTNKKFILSYRMPFSDPTLSHFANWVLSQFLFLENNMKTSWCHRILFVILNMACDAYRHVSQRTVHRENDDPLHFNSFLYGEKATSKSFVWKVLQILCIGLTVSFITDSSERASTSNHDQNHRIRCYDEISLSLMGFQAAGGSSKTFNRGPDSMLTDTTSRFKMELTNQISIREILVISHEPFQRNMHTVMTELIGVVNASSNILDLTKMDSAAVSRFEMFNFCTYNRTGYNPADLMSQLDEWIQSGRVPFEDHRQRFYAWQFLVAHVEFMIASFLLTRPTLACYHALLPILSETLRNECGGSFELRQIQRFYLRVRYFTIRNALHYVFGVPTSPCYMKPFDPRDLLLLDPFLHDTPEIVYFAFECCYPNYIDHKRTKFMKIFRDWFFSTSGRAEHRNVKFLNSYDLGVAFSPAIVASLAASISNQRSVFRPPSVGRLFDDNNSQGSIDNSNLADFSMAATRRTPEMNQFVSRHGQSYYLIDLHQHDLTNALKTFSQNGVFSLDTETIAAELRKLCATSFQRPPYHILIDEDRKPVLDENGRYQFAPQAGDDNVQMAFWSSNRTVFFLHVSLFIDCDSVGADTCIQRCYDRYTNRNQRRGRKRDYLSAREDDPRTPHLLQRRTSVSQTSRVHKICVETQEKNLEKCTVDDRTPEERNQPTRVIDMDLETYSLHRRLMKLHMPLDEKTVKAFDFATLDRRLVSELHHINQTQNRYPDDFRPRPATARETEACVGELQRAHDYMEGEEAYCPAPIDDDQDEDVPEPPLLAPPVTSSAPTIVFYDPTPVQRLRIPSFLDADDEVSFMGETARNSMEFIGQSASSRRR